MKSDFRRKPTGQGSGFLTKRPQRNLCGFPVLTGFSRTSIRGQDEAEVSRKVCGTNYGRIKDERSCDGRIRIFNH